MRPSPVGLNVFAVDSVVHGVGLSTIFKGVLPFMATDLVRLIVLIAFPIRALWLPSKM
jgi:TRAP-type C4-dicarboxylate transport system permease large subunit